MTKGLHGLVRCPDRFGRATAGSEKAKTKREASAAPHGLRVENREENQNQDADDGDVLGPLHEARKGFFLYAYIHFAVLVLSHLEVSEFVFRAVLAPLSAHVTRPLCRRRNGPFPHNAETGATPLTIERIGPKPLSVSRRYYVGIASVPFIAVCEVNWAFAGLSR